MNPKSHSRYDVMSRVRTVRGVRKLLTSPVTNGLVGIGLFCCLALLVSLGDVFANTMAYEHWSERLSYVFSSFTHSRFVVQTLLGLILSLSFMLFAHVVRKIPLRKIFLPFGSTQQV